MATGQIALDPLIGEARRRARRRRLGLAAIAVAVAAGSVVVAVPHGDRQSAPPARISAPAPSPLRLVGAPYLGVACPGAPNSIACDRVGLAVTLPTTPVPAVVTATIDGRGLPLAQPTRICWGDLPCRMEYQGFLQPAGLLHGALKVRPDDGRYSWFGTHATVATVRVVARYRGGRSAATTRRVPLSPGYG